jgi:hypothetical protein
MHPFTERMRLAPKMTKQLLKILQMLEKIQAGDENIDPVLLNSYEKEKEAYNKMDARFKELSEIVVNMDKDRPVVGNDPKGGKRSPSRNTWQ